MTELGTAVVPRRVGLVARSLVAVVMIGVLPGSLIVPVLYAEMADRDTRLIVALGLLGMATAVSVMLNYGFAPRVRGSVLEVRTLLGRQTVDLSRLVAVGHQQLGWKTVRPRLRLRDPQNVVAIRPPRADVHNAVCRAVWEASGRGVMVAPEVPTMLGMPPLPGMMDRNSSVIGDLAILGAMAIGVSVCGALGTLIVLLNR